MTTTGEPEQNKTARVHEGSVLPEGKEYHHDDDDHDDIEEEAVSIAAAAIAAATAVTAATPKIIIQQQQEEEKNRQSRSAGGGGTSPRSPGRPQHQTPATTASANVAAAAASNAAAEKTLKQEMEELGKSPGEVAFFRMLHSEFKKASHFFETAQQEFAIREERVRHGMDIYLKQQQRPSSSSGSSIYPVLNNKQNQWYLLAKSIYRLYKDLLLFETFCIMTVTSYSKILKKHDKVTGRNTRTAFMQNVVMNANFTQYPTVLAMIARCETLYDRVSTQQLLEAGLFYYDEDERLFIDMIHQFNHPGGSNNNNNNAQQQPQQAPLFQQLFTAKTSE